MSKHKNLSIFIPHLGCPNQCSFCDQHSISGAEKAPSAEQVWEMCNEFLPKEDGKNCEIAFFGGSFTAIDKTYMQSLLQTASEFIACGRAEGIRISTRPDCIDEEILKILKKYGVTSIELGAQSMQDDVLLLNKRGHTCQDVEKAAALIKQYGFSLGLQMMTGLYGQNDYMACAVDTAQKFVELSPDTVRIYPTLTLKNTMLEQVYNQGKYIPPDVEQTVEICAVLMDIFKKANIKIIKMGLHSDVGMEQKIVAGPYHPAFRELCLAKEKLNKIKYQLTNIDKKSITIKVNPSRLSQWKGQKNSNIHQLALMGYNAQIVADGTIKEDDFIIV